VTIIIKPKILIFELKLSKKTTYKKERKSTKNRQKYKKKLFCLYKVHMIQKIDKDTNKQKYV